MTTKISTKRIASVPSAMCIQSADLDWHGRTTRPIAVYCGVTLTVLGKSETPVGDRDPDDNALVFGGCLRFGGVTFQVGPRRTGSGSAWRVLEALVPLAK